MNSLTKWLLLATAMCAFAANSLLCRVALRHDLIDPASFTSIRLGSGALVLAAMLSLRGGIRRPAFDLRAALALFVYAACFSFAYVDLSAGTGALLVFSAVQMMMIGVGLWRGDRSSGLIWTGFALAAGGLIYLLAPGVTAPRPGAAALMLTAGAAWGVYSLRGAGRSDPIAATTWNFIAASPLALLLNLALAGSAHASPAGIGWAVLSGAIASAIGYVIWYRVLPLLPAIVAATVQLSAPMLAGFGGVLLLGEPATARLGLASIAILGGIAVVILARQRQLRRALATRPS